MVLIVWSCVYVLYVFFFKQKTAYEMRISDWSSDVCSSDLKLLGVTVLRGRVGFGHSNLVHATSFLDHNYPLIVEIVDMPATLRNFAAQLHQLKGIGAMTLLPVEPL